jgi:hypothetical protein
MPGPVFERHRPAAMRSRDILTREQFSQAFAAMNRSLTMHSVEPKMPSNFHRHGHDASFPHAAPRTRTVSP